MFKRRLCVLAGSGELSSPVYFAEWIFSGTYTRILFNLPTAQFQSFTYRCSFYPLHKFYLLPLTVYCLLSPVYIAEWIFSGAYIRICFWLTFIPTLNIKMQTTCTTSRVLWYNMQPQFPKENLTVLIKLTQNFLAYIYATRFKEICLHFHIHCWHVMHLAFCLRNLYILKKFSQDMFHHSFLFLSKEYFISFKK